MRIQIITIEGDQTRAKELEEELKSENFISYSYLNLLEELLILGYLKQNPEITFAKKLQLRNVQITI